MRKKYNKNLNIDASYKLCCFAGCGAWFFTEILTGRRSFEIWIVKRFSLTFAMAKDDRRERHRSLLHFP